MGNLLSSRPRHHRKLPAELNREIFLCFNPAAQRKFICGLGWDFYAMFRHRLLTKTKRVRNPHENRWDETNTRATIAADGLHASNNTGYAHAFAVQPFLTSEPHCRMDQFPGTMLYYFEVKGDDLWCYVGLSDGTFPVNLVIGQYSNSYAIQTGYYEYECWLAGETHQFELPEVAIQPRREYIRFNVHGCGLVLHPKDKLWIFFTLNGKLRGRKIPISPTVDRLFPAVTIRPDESFEENFGDDPAKPFEYDIYNCPGLGLACI